MADIVQPDLQSLISALSAGDNRGKALATGVNSFTSAFESARTNKAEAAKQALKDRIEKAGIISGGSANAARPDLKLDEGRDYDSALLKALTPEREPAPKLMDPLDRQLKQAQIDLTRARTRAANSPTQKTAARGIEAKNKATLYVGQARVANDLLNSMAGKFTGRFDRIENVPERFRSGPRKSFEGAARRFASAVLRPETGAQANEQEIIDTQRRFIEQPGDTPDVQEEKRAARKTFINLLGAIAEGDTDAGLRLDELIAVPSTISRAAKVRAEQQSGVALGGDDLSSMSDEELEAELRRITDGGQ